MTQRDGMGREVKRGVQDGEHMYKVSEIPIFFRIWDGVPKL